MGCRVTRFLPHRAAANFSLGIEHADVLGRSLALLVTINYGHTMCPEHLMVASFRRLLKSFFGKWFARHPVHQAGDDRAPTYAWVAEGRAGHPGIHWLVFVPPAMEADFRKELERWVVKTAGPLLDPTAIDIKRVWRSKGIRDYLLKGLAPHHARRFNLKNCTWQGEVTGKRCGVSENLGPTAIARYRANAGLEQGLDSAVRSSQT